MINTLVLITTISLLAPSMPQAPDATFRAKIKYEVEVNRPSILNKIDNDILNYRATEVSI